MSIISKLFFFKKLINKSNFSKISLLVPSLINSQGIPIFLGIFFSIFFDYSGTFSFEEVESFESYPEITSKHLARPKVVFENGPI